MSEVTSTGAVVAGTKGLWAAVGVLGVAVVGLGGALYATVQEKTEPLPILSAAPAEPVAAAPVAPAQVAEKPVAATAAPAKPRPAPVKKTQAPAETRPAPVVVAPLPAPVPVCGDCATVSAVTPVEREVPTSGTGAIAGGVLGAIVGNQVGHGSGRDAARIIGAIGGGIAGNQIEKKMKKVVAYQIELRMDDGSRRSFELDRPLTVGERVHYDGNTLQPLPAGKG